MTTMVRASLFLTITFLLLSTGVSRAQTTGRIDGTVTDGSTNEALPGVNVVIVGTQQGAVTNAEGYYTIVGVRPGTYSLQASFIGFTDQTVEDVRVNVGLTTTIDLQLQDQAIGLDEVFVTAERPIVQRDISANIATLSARDVENLPVVSVEGVIGLQAGIEPGLNIRGSGGADVAVYLDGMNMSTGRSNSPFTGMSYTAIEEIQVQTGGFDAEYGDLRSGLVTVTTKEGPRDRYTADVIMRYSPASQKHFGGLATDRDSYNLRPYFDPAVAFVGTSNGEWDQWTQQAYPTFQGWNAVADQRGDGTPPEKLQEAFEWLVRRDATIQVPDYEVDASIGGPIPGGENFGNLRFMASYRQTQTAYMVPQNRDAYTNQLGQGKLNADLGRGMRVAVQGIYSLEKGINSDAQANEWGFDRGELPRYPWDGRSQLMNNRVGGDLLHWISGYRWNPSDITRFTIASELTHMVTPSTFYNVRLQRTAESYDTFQPRERNPEIVHTVFDDQGNPIFELDEAPLGWVLPYVDNPVGGGVGFQVGGQWAMGRDTSEVTRWTVGFDVTSQVNRYVQAKAGIDYSYSDFDIRHGQYDPANPHHDNPKYSWSRQPQQGAAYARTKLEFQGMVANLGLRLDYFSGGGEWWSRANPFSLAYSAVAGGDLEGAGLEQDPVRRHVSVSPRIGVSFPITEHSKLFFNYGHMRRSPDPNNIYRIARVESGAVTYIGDPNVALVQTVAYEVGYEHNLFDMFLLRLGGYYRDNSRHTENVRFINLDQSVNYQRPLPYGYQDVRGLEVTLNKLRGDWLRGFVNVTYMASRGGRFGVDQVSQNPVTQFNYEQNYVPPYGVGIPEPYAHFNIEFLVPRDLGPQVGDSHPLGDWRINFLGEWRAGSVFTWNGNNLSQTPLIANNVQWKDYYNLDLRFSKAFNAVGTQAQFFMDVTNVLNFRHMARNVFFGNNDNLQRYYRSLHLPADTFDGLDEDPYVFIPGNDRPGTMRKQGAVFVPVIAGESLPEAGQRRTQGLQGPLYWVRGSNGGGTWYAWDGSNFVDPAQVGIDVDQVLKDKAYIEMPYRDYAISFNPRNVYFGVRFAF